MRIVVCVKHVPDLMSDRALVDGRVDRAGDGTLNELDENAVEAALVVAESAGAEVIALTMGPDDAVDAVRRALQMGADRAVHVVDGALAGTDVFGTAAVLGAAIRHIEADGVAVDLVVTGMASLDALTSMVPAALAATLDLPQLTLATSVEVDGTTVTVRRELPHISEVIEADLPVLISVTDQANEPRYPAFAGIMAAKKKPVAEVSLADLGIAPSQVGEAGSRTEVLSALARPPRADRTVITDDGDAGVRLAEFLIERRLVAGEAR